MRLLWLEEEGGMSLRGVAPSRYDVVCGNSF